MDAKGKIKLNYTEEFRIACKINNLKYGELIQYFIDHVSFYAFIGGDMQAIYLWATTVCIDCKEETGTIVKTITDQEIKDISLKYIKRLTALSLETGLSGKTEESRSTLIMKEWALEMTPLTDYQTELYTESDQLFYLSFDFNLLCRMNGCNVELLLQYFIDKISLARERATNLFQIVKTDPSTAVLLLLVSSHDMVKNRIMPQQHIYKRFGLQLLELDQRQKEEDNLQKRINSYSTFYKEWYTALTENIN